MTFAILGRRTALLATRRSAAVVASNQQAKRRMGSAAAPEWTGIDKVVRGYFPQDDQRELTMNNYYFGGVYNYCWEGSCV